MNRSYVVERPQSRDRVLKYYKSYNITRMGCIYLGRQMIFAHLLVDKPRAVFPVGRGSVQCIPQMKSFRIDRIFGDVYDNIRVGQD